MDDDRKLGIDGWRKQPQAPLVHDDGVGAIVGEGAEQCIVAARVGKWPVGHGVVQGNKKQRTRICFEQPPQAQGSSGLAHADRPLDSAHTGGMICSGARV